MDSSFIMPIVISVVFVVLGLLVLKYGAYLKHSYSFRREEYITTAKLKSFRTVERCPDLHFKEKKKNYIVTDHEQNVEGSFPVFEFSINGEILVEPSMYTTQSLSYANIGRDVSIIYSRMNKHSKVEVMLNNTEHKELYYKQYNAIYKFVKGIGGFILVCGILFSLLNVMLVIYYFVENA